MKKNIKKLIILSTFASFLFILSFSYAEKGSPCNKCFIHKGEKKEACIGHKKLKGPNINTTVLRILIESGLPLVVLDARSGEWDDKTRIPGAKPMNNYQ